MKALQDQLAAAMAEQEVEAARVRGEEATRADGAEKKERSLQLETRGAGGLGHAAEPPPDLPFDGCAHSEGVRFFIIKKRETPKTVCFLCRPFLVVEVPLYMLTFFSIVCVSTGSRG